MNKDEEISMRNCDRLFAQNYHYKHNCEWDGHEWEIINEINTIKPTIFGVRFSKSYIQKCKFCGQLHCLDLTFGNWIEENIPSKKKEKKK